MKNPFYVREIPVSGAFCNREKELNELTRHALNRMNVVLFSPRRFGKTSLAKRVMESVRKKHLLPIYVDLVKVTSIEDITGRLAAKIFEFTHPRESIFKKAMRYLKMWRPVLRPNPEVGMEVTVEPAGGNFREKMLEETLEALQEFAKSERKGCYVVLDEFQDITSLPNSANIEGRMRSHIQRHDKISYLFVGSKQHLLADMFRDRERAFYQSGTLYPLKSIEVQEFSRFIHYQFRSAGIQCSKGIAEKITSYTNGHPYYTQKLAYFVFENAARTAREADVSKAIGDLHESEKLVFEIMAGPLAPQQMSLALAIAREPTRSIFSPRYMSKHQLGSIGGVQGAIGKLLELDYIEKDDKGFKIIDPLFRHWLLSLSYK